MVYWRLSREVRISTISLFRTIIQKYKSKPKKYRKLFIVQSWVKVDYYIFWWIIFPELWLMTKYVFLSNSEKYDCLVGLFVPFYATEKHYLILALSTAKPFNVLVFCLFVRTRQLTYYTSIFFYYLQINCD